MAYQPIRGFTQTHRGGYDAPDDINGKPEPPGSVTTTEVKMQTNYAASPRLTFGRTTG